MDKITLRKGIKKKREALGKEFVNCASAEITDKFIDNYLKENYLNYLLYSDFRNEVETTDIINKLLRAGKNVFLPIVDGDDVIIGRYSDVLEAGSYGIMEPGRDDIVPSEVIDVFVVPGIAFDKKGGRIGFGKGYYDRLLMKSKKGSIKVALAYEMQIVDDAHSEKHDFMMDSIVTEAAIYEVKK